MTQNANSGTAAESGGEGSHEEDLRAEVGRKAKRFESAFDEFADALDELRQVTDDEDVDELFRDLEDAVEWKENRGLEGYRVSQQ